MQSSSVIGESVEHVVLGTCSADTTSAFTFSWKDIVMVNVE